MELSRNTYRIVYPFTLLQAPRDNTGGFQTAVKREKDRL